MPSTFISSKTQNRRRCCRYKPSAATIAAVLPLLYHGPAGVCGFSVPHGVLRPSPPTATTPPSGHQHNYDCLSSSSSSSYTAFGCSMTRSLSGISGGGKSAAAAAGTSRFKRRLPRSRSTDGKLLMVSYNPNDELRAIVERKQYEIKAFLKQHSADDDRLQVGVCLVLSPVS